MIGSISLAMNALTASNNGTACSDIDRFNASSVAFPECIPGFGMSSLLVFLRMIVDDHASPSRIAAGSTGVASITASSAIGP